MGGLGCGSVGLGDGGVGNVGATLVAVAGCRAGDGGGVD